MRRFVLLLLLSAPLHAIVWRADLRQLESVMKGEMRQVGKVYYSPLKIFGSSCLSLGEEWVLTCRHGTEKWAPLFLTVEFPGLGKERYGVERIILPESGDLALLKLKKKVPKTKSVTLFDGTVRKNQRVWIGGFGRSGPVGKVRKRGEFFAGHNRVDRLRGGKISISLSELDDKFIEKNEAILALFDSGSPLFLETKKGWQLAGVASTASNGRNPKIGDRGNYARTTPAIEWIQKTTSGNETE